MANATEHGKWRKLRASLGRLWSVATVEVVGLASIAGGLWMVFPPSALIVGGIGLVAWAQGYRSRGASDAS